MALIALIAYFVVLGALALLGVYRLQLLYLAFGARRRRRSPAAAPAAPVEWPKLAVQLPLYNEALVAERLIRACARLRYPGVLQIQVIDDSNDDTRAIVARVAAELSTREREVIVLRRPEREGFKAGALAYALQHTGAELIAIFDADFVPAPDFLEQTVPALLAAEKNGMAQARWGHLNRELSLLTRAQAVFLDGHFAVEHQARSSSGRFFNFNGTAGVWRRRAIEEAGGWSHDTITEDLDLSYRAQLAGWRFIYLDEVIAPAELPETVSAFRAQQARWVRGSMETAKKHLFAVLSARAQPLAVRFDAAIHLTTNFAYLLMALLAVLLPIAVIIRAELGWRVPGGQTLLSALDLSMLTAGTFAMIAGYVAASIRTGGRLRIAEVLFALCAGAGMSFSNAREVLAGLFGRSSIFVRTPKRGDAAIARYRSRSALGASTLELGFAAYYAGTIAYALDQQLWGALPFLMLYLVGFVAIGAGEVAYLISSSETISVMLRSSGSSGSSGASIGRLRPRGGG